MEIYLRETPFYSHGLAVFFFDGAFLRARMALSIVLVDGCFKAHG